MKKLDYLIILLVILISGSMICIYFSNNRVDSDDMSIQILFENKEIYEIKMDGKSYNLNLSGAKGTNTLTLKVMDQYYNEITTKTYAVKLTKDINYNICCSDEQTYVTEAWCTHHYCLKMKLTKTLKTPIICTDGLTIKYKNNNDITIITGE